MFVILLYVQIVVHAVLVLSEAPPAPQRVRVEKGQMTWALIPEETNVTYTVQSRRFQTTVWTDVPTCTRISSTRCDVAQTQAENDYGCVSLRVLAQRGGLRSAAVEACSTSGDSCSPKVLLRASPGSLAVHLYVTNHSLGQEYGDHAQHRVSYGKEGEPLKFYEDKVSSVSIPGLQGGQRYCVQVQYRLYRDVTGLPSCPTCELVPESEQAKQAGNLLLLILLLVPILFIPFVVYCLMCGLERIKQWLKTNKYEIPPQIFDVPCSEQQHQVHEHFDVISSITPLQHHQHHPTVGVIVTSPELAGGRAPEQFLQCSIQQEQQKH